MGARRAVFSIMSPRVASEALYPLVWHIPDWLL